MALQESLRELVASRGPRVTVDATEFRGALDDFLGEDEATTGEVNLLVDAVRLGGLARLVALLDAGASPQAAVLEAGTALARDRGSDDDRRSRWAVAVLGFAIGRLDAAFVPSRGAEEGDTGRGPVPPAGPSLASPPPPPPGQPWSAPAAASAPGQQDGTVYVDEAPGPAGLTAPAGPAGLPPRPLAPPAPPPAAPRRRGIGLVVLAIALVLGLVAGVGFAVWQSQRGDDSGGSSGDSSSSADSGGATTIPDNAILLPYRDDAGALRIYRVNADNGRWSPLTDGTADDLPTISPDRTEFTYLDTSSGFPVLFLRHVGSDEAATQVFPSSGRCEHALRPGWSLDGTRFAIVCTGNDGRPDGIFVCASDGSGAQQVLEGTDFRGSPTWVSDNTFIYGTEDPATGADTFSAYDMSTGTPVPLALPDDPTAHVTHADWSQEADALLFLVHDSDDTYGHLWVADAGMHEAHQLGTTEYAHPVWSPDGKQIAALWRAPDGSEELVTIDPASPDDPDILADQHPQPNGVPTIPVWGSR
ncbi:hypothetical protein [Nocardioides panacisoli]|uniref:WD40 repeat domain-containing protein n=1 Tax=Nocardioides panacisoli TaxID=627624 RepID=A0ABP7IZE1_9ACTN